jgi:Predicted membrane protein (DUF2306)
MLIELKLLGKQKTIPGVDHKSEESVLVSPEPPVEIPSSLTATQPETEARVEEKPAENPVARQDERFFLDGHMGTRVLLLTSIVFSFWYLNTAALKYLTPSPDTYGIFWPRYPWLYAHAVAGTLALVLGPFQFWPGLKKSRPMLHRAMGTVYATSAGVGSLAAFYLAFHTDFGWMYAIGLTSMAMAWLISTGLATVAIYRRMIPQHREWMIRSYVVTFGFVVLRLVVDLLEMKNIGTVPERLIFASWVCWSVPLLITEALMQGRKVFARTVEARIPPATL